MSLVFQCRYCPATFPQFKQLVRHYEACHNQEGKQYRKLRESAFYKKNDSGCSAATEYLGYQSSCLKCPFRKCVFDEPGVGVQGAKKRNRNEEIIKRWKESESISDLAVAFDVSKRTIQRVIASAI